MITMTMDVFFLQVVMKLLNDFSCDKHFNYLLFVCVSLQFLLFIYLNFIICQAITAISVNKGDFLLCLSFLKMQKINTQLNFNTKKTNSNTKRVRFLNE